jgi:FkbM family methyltransferase
MHRWLRYQLRKLLRPRVITNGDMRIDLGPAAGTRYARSFYRDDHERDEREIVARHLQPDDVVVELGAGVGLVTILCCRQIGSERVHAFEANPQLAETLRRNFALNGVSPQLHLKLVALAGGRREFQIAERFIASTACFDPASPPAGTRAVVEAVPLAEVLTSLRPTFLIVDIEGGELDLADPSVPLESVRKLCVEMHPHQIGDVGVTRVVAALLARGFEMRLTDCRGNVLYFERSPTSARPEDPGVMFRAA